MVSVVRTSPSHIVVALENVILAKRTGGVDP